MVYGILACLHNNKITFLFLKGIILIQIYLNDYAQYINNQCTYFWFGVDEDPLVFIKGTGAVQMELWGYTKQK